MSATAVAPAPSLRNDLAACGWHCVARFGMAVRDPFALGLLAFAGAVTVPLWSWWLGIHPLWARHYPWPGGPVFYNGPAPTAVRLAFYQPFGLVVLTQVLWAALVAWALGRESAQGQWSAARALPALPIGPRARVVADALVAIALAMAARAVVLSWGGVRLGQTLFGHDPRLAVFPDLAWLFSLAQPAESTLTLAAYVSAFVVSTLLGTLLVFPLVLAWSTTARLDWRGFVKPTVAVLLLFAAVGVGAMAHVASAVLVSVLVCVFLVARLDAADHPETPSASRAPRVRASPGPLVQLRRDAWLRLLETRWMYLALAVTLPFVPTLAYETHPFGYASTSFSLFAKVLAGMAALLQWLVLMALPFLPFGLALIPSGVPSRALFSGAFLQSWCALPLPRTTVLRAVYAHGLLGAGFAWLVLCAHARLLGARFGPVLYELPAVFLVAGLVVCEAVGDRRRGLLAVGALVGFQFGVPVAHAIGSELLGRLPAFGSHGARLTIAAYAVALFGVLPPLVHLRERAASPRPSPA